MLIQLVGADVCSFVVLVQLVGFLFIFHTSSVIGSGFCSYFILFGMVGTNLFIVHTISVVGSGLCSYFKLFGMLGTDFCSLFILFQRLLPAYVHCSYYFSCWVRLLFFSYLLEWFALTSAHTFILVQWFYQLLLISHTWSAGWMRHLFILVELASNDFCSYFILAELASDDSCSHFILVTFNLKLFWNM